MDYPSDTTESNNPRDPRAAGILLHPTSLPGRFGIGDLGPEVGPFLDWIRTAGFKVWQMLPLGPSAIANSPYTALSAFAGNPLLISPERLLEEGLLDETDLDGAPPPRDGRVDFGEVTPWKEGLLRHSWEHFSERASEALREELTAFRGAPEQSWLEDWTLFCSLRNRMEHPCWWDWPEELRSRDPEALERARQELAEEMDYHAYVQFLFFHQWQVLRSEASERGIELLGDLPIYVGLDSSEVWSRPELFELDEKGAPLGVAGVPPDYFSETGQLWGNPLYRWDRMAEDDYAWWVDRLAANLRLTDRVRLDHFRAFAAYWRVPAGDKTAVNGTWVTGPGRALFDALETVFGSPLPLVAEDLGEITPDVHELRNSLDLPGMRVLHFAFDDVDGDHIPHRLTPCTVIYTGTHDNNTTVGWYHSASEETRQRFAHYTGHNEPEGVEIALIRLAYTAVAELAVVPAQDVLGLGSEARMNTPGLAEGNWVWRLNAGQLTDGHAERLRQLAEVSARLPTSPTDS